MAAEARRAIRPLVDHLPRYLGRVLDELAFSAWEPGGGKLGRTKGYLATPNEVLDPRGWYIATSDTRLAIRVRGYDMRPGETNIQTEVVAAARRTLLALGIIIGGSLRLGVKTAPAGTWFAPTYELNLSRIDLTDLGWLNETAATIYALFRGSAARIRDELPQVLTERVPLDHFGSAEWRDLTLDHLTNYRGSHWLCWDGLIPTITRSSVQKAILAHVHRGAPFPAGVQAAPPQCGIPTRIEQPLLLDEDLARPSGAQDSLFTPVPAPTPAIPTDVLDLLNGDEAPLADDDPWFMDLEAPAAAPMTGPDPDDVPDLALSAAAAAQTTATMRRETAATIATQEALLDVEVPADKAKRRKEPKSVDPTVALVDSVIGDYLSAAKAEFGLDLYTNDMRPQIARYIRQLRNLVRWMVTGELHMPGPDAVRVLMDLLRVKDRPTLLPPTFKEVEIEINGRHATSATARRQAALRQGESAAAARTAEQKQAAADALMAILDAEERAAQASPSEDHAALANVGGWSVRPPDPQVRVGAR